jgi:hypothetical protein
MRNDTSATLGRRGAGWRPFALFAVLGALIAGLVVVPVSVARGAVPVETVPSAPVVIDVPPGAPIVSGLRTESGGDMILTVDPDPGSPAPTEYRVDARSVIDPGSPVVTVTGAGPQLVVSGLTAREVYDVTVVAVNASGESTGTALRVRVNPGDEFSLITGEPVAATVGSTYSHRFAITGPFLADVPGGQLPDGLAFDPLTDTISGTPTESGTFPLVVFLGLDVYSYDLVVAPAPAVEEPGAEPVPDPQPTPEPEARPRPDAVDDSVAHARATRPETLAEAGALAPFGVIVFAVLALAAGTALLVFPGLRRRRPERLRAP